VNANDLPFSAHRPYVATPNSAYSHTHHLVGSTNTGPI